ncbi:MAG: CHASE2 domain-containing protein, partial [Methylococcales bacterium]
ALLSFVFSIAIDYVTNLESIVGLDTLFYLRGVRSPPNDVVIVALDEASETRLGVGRDLTRWRAFHAGLIGQLQRQGTALIVFDLQFIVPHPGADEVFAAAIAKFGNVLLTDCVQKFRRGTEDYFGREECSESYKTPSISKEGQFEQVLSEQLVAMRRILATPVLIDSALDHAPFFLGNDAKDSTVRETWIFYDALAEIPSLPVVAWLIRLRQRGKLNNMDGFDVPVSVWLTERRRQCLADKDHRTENSQKKSALEKRIDDVICGEDSRYLDYYGPPRTFRMESYSDVYEGKITDLRNKVILVGKANRLFASGKTDFFQSPFTDSHSGKMAGVEIMATQFANLSEGRFVASPLPRWLLPIAFGVVIGLLFTRFT